MERTVARVGAALRPRGGRAARASRLTRVDRSGRDVGLTLATLNAAVRARRPRPGLVFHSDRGIEYAAQAFRDRLAEFGIVQSMSRPGRPTDNAHMESFFHSMKADAIHQRGLFGEEAYARAIGRYVLFYNQRRLHSGLGYVPPATFEARAA